MHVRASESLDAGEVGDHVGGILQWLIDLEEMRIAMDENDLSTELHGLLHKGIEERGVTILAGQTTLVVVFGLGNIKPRIALNDDHEALVAFRLGFFERRVHPLEVRLVAL